MHILLFYLFTFIFSFSRAMEKPLQKPFYAPYEVVVKATTAVTNDYLKRLHGLLQTHVFAPEDMVELLKYAMGDKALQREFMGPFILLLHYGAPLNLKVDLGPYIDAHISKVTPFEYAIMNYPAYIKPLALFGARFSEVSSQIRKNYGKTEKTKPYIDACNIIARKNGNFVRAFLKTQMTGRAMPIARERYYISKVAMNCAATYREAVCHEDIDALKQLLTQPFNGTDDEKKSQLAFATSEAITLENLAALDELAKHAAPIAEKLSSQFFFHPDLLLHCARKKYITMDDLNNCKSRVPQDRIGSMLEWTPEKFNTERVRVLAIIEAAQRLLERPEPEIATSNKKAKKVLRAKRSLNSTESEAQTLPKLARVVKKDQ